MAEITPEAKNRFQNTNLQGFDQLVALTQDNINDTLYYAFTIANQSPTATGPLKVEADGASLDAEITPPRVDLTGDHKDPHKVLYILHLKSGTFVFLGADKKPQSISIADWYIAFTVNLALADAQSLPSNLASKVSIPGHYNVKQLGFDFATAELQRLDPAQTKTPGADILKDPNQKAAMQSLLKRYTESLRSGATNVIGYAITVADPNVANPKAPTFPPTALAFQTCAYRGESRRGENMSGYNTLLFLEMTNRRPLPNVILPESCWAVPSMSGTMAISARNLWDYLIPKLNQINNQSAVVATGAKCKGMKSSWQWEFGLHGNQPFQPAGTAWVFNHEAKKKDEENDVVAKFSCSTKSTVKNMISFIPGSNEIRIAGKSTLNLSLKHNVVGVPEKAWGKSWVEWSFSIVMKAVTDGGLEFTTTEAKPTSGSDTGGDLLGKLENSITGDMDKMTAGLRNSMTKKLNVDEWASSLATALSGQRQFVLPGSGDFLFKNPILNAHGDLLIELTYKQ